MKASRSNWMQNCITRRKLLRQSSFVRVDNSMLVTVTATISHLQRRREAVTSCARLVPRAGCSFLHWESRDPESTGGCTHSATDVRCRPGRLEERCTWLRSILLRSAPHPPRPYIAQRTDALRTLRVQSSLSTWACQISNIATATPMVLDFRRGGHWSRNKLL